MTNLGEDARVEFDKEIKVPVPDADHQMLKEDISYLLSQEFFNDKTNMRCARIITNPKAMSSGLIKCYSQMAGNIEPFSIHCEMLIN